MKVVLLEDVRKVGKKVMLSMYLMDMDKTS